MADGEPLKPDDFPDHTNRKQDFTQRLNAEEGRGEVDRWA